MEITYREVDFGEIDLFNLLAKWANDPEIRPFSTPRFSEDEYPKVHAIELMASLMEKPSKHTYMVFVAQQPVAEFSIDMHFEHLVTNQEDVAWISIVIGDSSFRGIGLGRRIMEFIEIEAIKLGATLIELGVFDYNERAIQLYKNVGFIPIATISNFVFNFGSWHSDIRMIKSI
ncbi:MAG: hypothetical protein BGO41_03920 [Clostridiales bacterium 38-18]|nr:MAG: hypothetical protein BGO41_03920 [Clostridiales bacterium 38-18]